MADMQNTEAFRSILAQAAKVKEAQLKANPSRRSWEEAPAFFQWTCGNYVPVLEARSRSEFSERLAMAEQMKECGNQLFVEDKLDEALMKYSNAIAVFVWFERKDKRSIDEVALQSDLPPPSSDERDRADSHLSACFLNAAAVCLKKHKPADAIYSCTKALQYRPNSAKAYYRRAQANYALASSYTLELAVQDLQKAAKLEPQDAAIRSTLAAWRAELAEQTKKDRRTFGNMLSRGSLYDDVEPIRTASPTTPSGVDESGLGWVKPPFSEEAKQQAKEMGIDLEDPDVQAQLMELHRQKLNGSDKAGPPIRESHESDHSPRQSDPTSEDPETFLAWWQALLAFKLRWRSRYLVYILLWGHALWRTWKIVFAKPDTSATSEDATELHGAEL